MKPNAPELINALTPVFIAMIGGIIGVTVLVTNSDDAAKWSAGMGLAGTAIAGAAGLAQSTKNVSTVTEERSSNLLIQKEEV
jgi:uncharacterized membrane protein